MAICLFTAKLPDGSGDVVHTVKVADFIQKFIQSSASEELQDEAVIIIVRDKENKKTAKFFVDAINPAIQVKTISKFEAEDHKINCSIEAAKCWFFGWENRLLLESVKPPLIVMPEYADDRNRSKLKILGGFDQSRGEVGVIPSPALLAATADEVISEDAFKKAFDQLDLKIQHYLGKNFNDYLAQREQREFTYQYSHDVDRYPTLYSDHVPYKPLRDDGTADVGGETIEGKVYTPVEFFLQEHIMLVGNSPKS